MCTFTRGSSRTNSFRAVVCVSSWIGTSQRFGRQQTVIWFRVYGKVWMGSKIVPWPLNTTDYVHAVTNARVVLPTWWLCSQSWRQMMRCTLHCIALHSRTMHTKCAIHSIYYRHRARIKLNVYYFGTTYFDQALNGCINRIFAYCIYTPMYAHTDRDNDPNLNGCLVTATDNAQPTRHTSIIFFKIVIFPINEFPKSKMSDSIPKHN